MKIQIHKNYFRCYWDIRVWDNVPEFVHFETIPSNMVSVRLDIGESVLSKGDDNKSKSKIGISDRALGFQEGFMAGEARQRAREDSSAKESKLPSEVGRKDKK